MLQVFLAFLMLLLYISFFRRRKHANYPSGPLGLPLLGNVLQLGQCPYLQLAKWKKKYGNMYSIKLGLDDAIVINDPKLLREFFSDKATTGRPENAVFKAITRGDRGVVMTDGRKWDEQRKFVMRTLRELGYSKASMEGLIVEEAASLMECFANMKGKPFNVEGMFNIAVVNSLWCIISGKQPLNECSTEEKKKLIQKTSALFLSLDNVTKSGLLFAPFLRFIFPEWSGWNTFIKAIDEIYHFTDESIDRHRKKLDTSCPQDLIDRILTEIKKTKDPDSSFFESKGQENLQAIVMELFVAGSETTSNTLAWILLYLSHHPEVQRKLRNEIHSVVGKTQPVSSSDKQILPCTEAVILEILRLTAVIPMGVLHRMMEDRSFNGYHVPENTVIITDIYTIHHDPEFWGDPENFRPERFLSEDGTTVIHHDALIPFGIGRRSCLGELLARDTLFIFTTSIFQRFEVLPDPNNPNAQFEANPGFTHFPKPFKIIMKELD